MSNEAKKLVQNTHLSVKEAEVLLQDRDLSGNPEEHDHPTILLTEDEVVVETKSLFANNSAESAIELAVTSGESVNSIRRGDSFGGGYYLSGGEDEE